MDDLPDEATALFRVPPEDFVRERDGLSLRLGGEGRAADAAAVKRLRKPTLALWALNRLAGDAPDDVAALRAAGRELRDAQQATVRGGGADRLRAATEDRRRAVGRLVEAAAAALEELGRDPAGLRDQLAAALEIASIDPEAGEALEAGTLTAVPAGAAGFGDVFGLAAVPDLPDEPATGTRRGASTARPDVAALRTEADRTERVARRDRESVERLAGELAQARAKADALAQALEEARARASASALEAKRAARARDRATR